MKAAGRIERLAAGRLGDHVLPILLGLGATLGFAPFGFYPMVLLGLVGLLFLWSGVTPRRAAWRGWVFGYAHFLSGIYWVYISIHRYGGAGAWLAALLVLFLMAYLALYPALVGYALTRGLRGSRIVLALLGLPAVWLLSELVRGWVMSGFPWLSLGYAFIDTPLKAFAPVIGVYGLGAIVAVMSGALWLALSGNRTERWWAFGAVALIACTLWLLPAPGSLTAASGPPLEVALVQGNIPQDQKWRPYNRVLTMQHYRKLTEPLWGGSRLIIWPEVAIPTLRSVVLDYLLELQDMAAAEGSTLLLGILVQDEDRDPLYNSMMELGKDTGVYYKRHLVPFGEYFPVPTFLLDFGSLLGLQYSDFSKGPEKQEPIRVDTVTLGVSICFEDAFGDEVRRSLPEAGVLVNVTNDAWFADSLAPHQHLQIARMRALETGRSLLRVANTGVSAVIGPSGELVAASPQFKVDVLHTQVTPRQGVTPYARYGDRPLWAVVILLAMLAGLRAFVLRHRA